MSTVMNDQVRGALVKLVASLGHELIKDPRRLRALLSDECPGQKREVSVLVAAVEHKVAAELGSKSSSVPWPVLAARLTNRLVNDAALSDEAARWAVESWGLALGRID